MHERHAAICGWLLTECAIPTLQVRLFEVIILLFTLLTALAAGLCMLHILDTPSRFETEKKDTTRHQD